MEHWDVESPIGWSANKDKPTADAANLYQDAALKYPVRPPWTVADAMEGGLRALDILEDIQTESLQTLLASVRRESCSAGHTFIPALDTHLSSVNAHRTSHKWPLNRGDVIEVQGPAASGKTHFLYHMLATCLMPSQHHGKHLGGWGKAAILFDVDGNFDISRLHELLVSRLTRLLSQEESHAAMLSVECDEVATQCLESLHIFRPTSSAQLAVTLLHLPNYHAMDPRLQDAEIGLLVVDSLSAFYWRDRYSLEQIRDAADSSSHAALPPNLLHHVVKAIQALRSSHRPVTLLSNWGLNAFSKPPGSDEPEFPFYRQHLHPFPVPFEAHGAAEAISNIQSSQKPRASNVDPSRDSPAGRARRQADPTLPLHYHITLHPSPIDSFPISYTLAEAVAHEHMRAALVNKGEIRGLVRTPGSSDVGEFAFWIGEKEIFVNDADRPP
ncbi:hypothetical protein GSI_06330 [Ganoderma sinense ZZ0214-1]|uniref:DNA recombination and repair protein Rad51-like C-terminal domain-containing protein n=1 Tax=Ganoderma sinense ZZ0214-1 TaxID=1077348 RepID=A0A2G8SDG4_9APHY|nr:hypothetical protein GSI_06330 [Ganoderma sinense ZZ0214-1]